VVFYFDVCVVIQGTGYWFIVRCIRLCV